MSLGTQGKQIQEVRTVGWSALPHLSVEYCLHWSLAFNRNDITEDAAIVVMALLIHELEGMILQRVSQIGSGCDYYVRKCRSAKRVPVEVSGLFEEVIAGQSHTRLKEKCVQVLRHNRTGYVSVTTFKHLDGQFAHSYLHYVVEPKSKPKNRRAIDTRKPRKRK